MERKYFSYSLWKYRGEAASYGAHSKPRTTQLKPPQNHRSELVNSGHKMALFQFSENHTVHKMGRKQLCLCYNTVYP